MLDDVVHEVQKMLMLLDAQFAATTLYVVHADLHLTAVPLKTGKMVDEKTRGVYFVPANLEAISV